MKIVFDYKIFFNQKFGGPSRYFSQLFENLNKDNENIAHIISPFYTNEYLQYSNYKKNIHGKKISSRKFFGRLYEYLNKKISKPIFSNLNPDILHTTYYDDHIINKKKPIVLTVYDMIHEIFYEEFGFEKNYKPKQKIIEKVDHFICISKNTQRDLIKYYGVEEKKTSVIYLSSFETTNRSLDIFKHEKPFFLFVGSRKRYKNFALLIKAFCSDNFINNNFDLICFGGGKFNRDEIELFKAQKLDLNKIHHFEGTDDLLISLYKSAAAYICTSLYEGFGLTILEAMRNGCPVISSNSSSLPEVYGDAALSFSPNSSEELLNCLNKITNDNILKESFKKKGLERANNFSWNNCAKETLKVYKSLI